MLPVIGMEADRAWWRGSRDIPVTLLDGTDRGRLLDALRLKSGIQAGEQIHGRTKADALARWRNRNRCDNLARHGEWIFL